MRCTPLLEMAGPHPRQRRRGPRGRSRSPGPRRSRQLTGGAHPRPAAAPRAPQQMAKAAPNTGPGPPALRGHSRGAHHLQSIPCLGLVHHLLFVYPGPLRGGMHMPGSDGVRWCPNTNAAASSCQHLIRCEKILHNGGLNILPRSKDATTLGRDGDPSNQERYSTESGASLQHVEWRPLQSTPLHAGTHQRRCRRP